MPKKPLTLSIVIPAFNEEHHLQVCLDSIARQTVKPDEIIVVNNNSDDRTAKVARSFSFVSVVTEPKQGIIYARTKGFNTAKGYIIARIDADTVLPQDWVERVKSFYNLPNNTKKALTGGPVFDGVVMPQLMVTTYRTLVFSLNRLLVGHPSLWGSNMAITKQQWEAVKTEICNRADIHEDLDLAMHLYNQGFRIIYEERLQVKAHLRRLEASPKDLWAYLMWWPRNLRLHKIKTWPLCWLVCASVFIATMFLKPFTWRF